jgi:hypothetical protein
LSLKSWDFSGNTYPDPPAAEDVQGFSDEGAETPTQEGDEIIIKLRNKDKPDQIMEVRFNTNQVQTLDSIARTLHPRAEGHDAMGKIMAKKLQETKWPAPKQDLPPVPPNNNKALSIMLEKDGDTYNWVFYETPRGEPAGCNTNKKPVFKGPNFSGVNIDDPPNPSGDYNMDVWGRPCKWHGNGENSGELICNDEHISCQDSTSATTFDCPNSSRKQHEGAFCEFFMEGSTQVPEQPPAPPPAVTPSVKTKALSIVLAEYWTYDPFPETYVFESLGWVFLASDIGKEGSCYVNGATGLKTINGPLKVQGKVETINDPPSPAGTFQLNVHGEDCEYRNDNTNAGGLFCGDKKYDCHDDVNRRGGVGATKECSSEFYHHPVITCEW